MRLFLGVDGGQSSTTALIGDEGGVVLGRGLGGPCNHATGPEGRAKLERAVAASLESAWLDAGLDLSGVQFDTACFGMSGGPDDKESILKAIIPTGRLVVTHDASTALAGATGDGQGIVVIAGTGAIAFGRNGAGKTARAGGWGYIFGDEGGAFDLVRQSLRAALRMEEGWGPPTALREALLNAGGAACANQLLHAFYTPEWPRSRVATLAPLVDTTAENGDAVALRILEMSAQELAMLAASVRSQLWQRDEAVEVAYVGGAFQSLRLLERFRLLVSLEEGNRCHAPLYGPAEGALLAALRAAGLNPHLSGRL